MAISDTLSQAANEIRRYLDNQPTMYSSVRAEIDRMLAEMDRLRVVLDDPQFDPSGPNASAYEALQSAICQVVPRE